MKITFSTILTLLLATIGTSQDRLSKVFMPWEHYTLANGLEVILQPDATQTDVAVEFWLKAGISHESPEQFGLAHFYEHVTPWSPMDSVDRAQLHARMTGSNAQVRKDYSRYFVQVEATALPLALRQTAGRLLAGAARISSRKVEYERKRVLAEIDRNANNPRWSVDGGGMIEKSTFGVAHPYGHSGYGRRQNNEHFTLEDCRAWHKKYVFADRVVLFVVGKFDSGEVKGLIEREFKDIPSSKFQPATITHPTAKHQQDKLSRLAPSAIDPDNTMVWTWAVPAFGTEEGTALFLLGHILQKRLEAKPDWPASVEKINVLSMLDLYRTAGKFGTYITFAEKGDSIKIEQLWQQTIDELSQNRITAKELEAAKQKEIERVSEQLNTLGFQSSRVELLGEGLLFTGQADFYYQRLQRQMDLEKEDIDRVVEKWLRISPFRILFISQI